MTKRFNELHAIRAIAATGVFVHHAEEFKKHAQIVSIGNYKAINALGGTSVTAFFVLSGFLLSYLLMKEKETTGSVHIKYFYLRRILRIWPLYFLTLVVYKLIVPEFSFAVLEILEESNKAIEYGAASSMTVPLWLEWTLLIFLLPHILLSLGVIFNPAHVWSIGVEEIFYIFWPWVILFSQYYLRTFIRIFTSYIVLFIISFLLLIYLMQSNVYGGTSLLAFCKFLFGFLYFERISCMAIGAIAAYLYLFKKGKIIRHIQSVRIFFPTALLLGYMILKGITLPIITNEIYSILFAILILNLITQSYSFFKIINNKVLFFLGDISYGIYMFNPLTLIITLEVFLRLKLDPQSSFYGYTVFYGVSFFLTVLISYLSFRVLERPFLKFKKYNK